MRNPLVLTAVTVCAVAIGCGGNDPGRSLFHGGAIVDVNTSPNYAVQTDAPSDTVVPGTDLGYYITASTGGSFRIFWSGDINTSGLRRQFYGSVWTEGNFSRVAANCEGACPLASDSFVSRVHTASGGARVDWDSFDHGGLQGFDFVIDTVPAWFDAFIDGRRLPDRIVFTGFDAANKPIIASVAQIPFGLTPQ